MLLVQELFFLEWNESDQINHLRLPDELKWRNKRDKLTSLVNVSLSSIVPDIDKRSL